MKSTLLIFSIISLLIVSGCIQTEIKTENQTLNGATNMHEVKLDNVTVTWLGHASFLVDGRGKNIYIDPYVLQENPEPADIILVTHEHFDHFDLDKINSIHTNNTEFFGPDGVINKSGFGRVLAVNDSVDVDGIKITAVEAYNVNKKFHPPGLGVGYVIEIGGKRIYHAGDTDNIKEMQQLKNIDLALLPVGGTYTMNVSEAAEAAKTIKPKILVPMHYNSDKYGVTGINADPVQLAKALAGKGIVVNILDPLV